MKILMVLTSHDQLGDTGKKTGFWLEEFAVPYYIFKDAGVPRVRRAAPREGRQRVAAGQGKRVTGFTNTEEEAVGLAKAVPFLVEDMLKERGGEYSKAADWKPYAINEGNLITGQNPASAEPAAKALLKQLLRRAVA